MAPNEETGGLTLMGVVLRRQRRQLANDNVTYRVTVLAGAQTEALELWNVPEDAVPALGSIIDVQVYVRAYVDRSKMARYSVGLATSSGDF